MLNPQLNRSALAQAYAQRKRVVVENVLLPDAAEILHDVMTRGVRWDLAYTDDDGPKALSPQALAAMAPEAQLALRQRIHARAQRQYQFLYHSYNMVGAYLEKRDPDLPLHAVLEFINSPDMIAFVEQVTGERGLKKADAQATLFAPGDFLKTHDDRDDHNRHNAGRRVAYVLGLTKSWQADWGGMLQFFDAKGDVEEGFMPRFNALYLFTVPQPHAVTYVAPFAAVGRFAVTGWFRDAI